MNTAKAVITIIAIVGLLAMACSDRPTPVDESQPTPAPTSIPVPPTPVDDSQPTPAPTSTPVPPTPVDDSQPTPVPTSTPVPPTPKPVDDSQPIPVPTSTPLPPTPKPVDESQPISAPTSTPVPPTPTPMPMPNVHRVEIGLGGSVQLPVQGIGISFDEVVEDSRCPANVVCVWAGEAVIELTVTKADISAAVRLSLRPGRVASFQPSSEDISMRLISLEPYPGSDDDNEGGGPAAVLEVMVDRG